MKKITDQEISINVGQVFSGPGSVFGEINVQLGEFHFPEEGWTDFMLIILGWWIDAALMIRGGESRVEDFLFMDGPFMISGRLRDSQIYLEFIENRKSRTVKHAAAVDFENFCSALRSAAREAIETVNLRTEPPNTNSAQAQIQELIDICDKMESRK